MTTARQVIEPYLVVQSALIRDSVDAVRADEPDAIHAARVASRRLRSVLATFAPLWDSGHGDVRRELRWYASVLSRARDLEVVGEWLTRLCWDPSTGPAGAAVADEVAARAAVDRRIAVEDLRRDLDVDRVAILTKAVPPRDWSSVGAVPAELVLVGLAAAPALAVVDEARRLPVGPQRPRALHDLRKSAKSARYAQDALGNGAAGASAAWKQVTESLGVAQDAWVARELLAELRRDAPAQTADWDAIGAAVDTAALGAERTGLSLLTAATALAVPDAHGAAARTWQQTD